MLLLLLLLSTSRSTANDDTGTAMMTDERVDTDAHTSVHARARDATLLVRATSTTIHNADQVHAYACAERDKRALLADIYNHPPRRILVIRQYPTENGGEGKQHGAKPSECHGARNSIRI